MVEFNTDFLFLTKPFVLVTMGDALLSWEFTTTVVIPLLAFLRFLSVSCFNPLHTKGGGVYFTQKWEQLQQCLPSLFFITDTCR